MTSDQIALSIHHSPLSHTHILAHTHTHAYMPFLIPRHLNNIPTTHCPDSSHWPHTPLCPASKSLPPPPRVPAPLLSAVLTGSPPPWSHRESLDALGAEGEQLLALRLSTHPVLGGLEVPPTLLAPQDRHLGTQHSTAQHTRMQPVSNNKG
jgi:hypothetical protein